MVRSSAAVWSGGERGRGSSVPGPASQTAGRAAQDQKTLPWGRKQQSTQSLAPALLPPSHQAQPHRGHQLGQGIAGWGSWGPKPYQGQDT